MKHWARRLRTGIRDIPSVDLKGELIRRAEVMRDCDIRFKNGEWQMMTELPYDEKWLLLCQRFDLDPDTTDPQQVELTEINVAECDYTGDLEGWHCCLRLGHAPLQTTRHGHFVVPPKSSHKGTL